MKAYKVTLPSKKHFTCLTDTPLIELNAAIFERFGVWPDKIESLEKKKPA
jgi:hypothetical protein